mmetsp:Transcript_45063/g.107077  ORF Transcript_45063/g.107077 Transcript_45063/m.107077 type:complete len:577 (+) Transcript_45063:123-1853(+)
MAQLTTDSLIEDTARQRRLSRHMLTEVWEALNRYISSSIDQQRTLGLPNFGQIGWRLGPTSRWKPFFQLEDSFIRAYAAESKGPRVPQDKVSAGEDLNFSKAAIKFSQNLTKDDFFTGFKALVQHIGETISTGQPVNIEFEVGKLIARDSAVSFEFSPHISMQENLEGDDMSLSSFVGADYRPAPTFSEPPPEAYTLSVHGSTPGATPYRAPSVLSEDAISQASSRSWTQAVPLARPTQDAGRTPPPRSVASSQMRGASNVVPSNSNLVPMATVQEEETQVPRLGQSSKFEAVHDQALGRHVAKLSEAAATAIAEKDMWEQHLQRCVEEEHKDQQWRRAIVKDYSEQLKAQIKQAEERRHRGRLEAIEQASMHDFPNFAEMHAINGVDAEAYVLQRKANLKADLDQQVAFKQRLQLNAKQRERDLEMSHNSAVQQEVEVLKTDGVEKRRTDMSNLCQAWEQQCKLRALRKAIDNHTRAGIQPQHIASLVSGVGSSAPSSARGVAGATGTYAGKPGVQLGVGGGDMPPRQQALVGYSGSEAGSGASRPVTGSVRRIPIGAAASLALQKERLAGGIRR